MLAKLTRLGISCDPVPSQLRLAREHFARHNYLRLPGFIEPALLQVIQRHLDRAGFTEKHHDVGRENRPANKSLANVLCVLMNDPKLFGLIRRITGCGPIGCFEGRLYRIVTRPGQAFRWHDDDVEGRKVAISINLSDAPYQGGTLEIRHSSGGPSEMVPNPGFGDAIIFRVAAHLQHRVSPVLGKFPKTAVTGWFCSRPGYTALHRELVARSESALATRAIRKSASRTVPAPNDLVKIPRAVVSQTLGDETFVANIDTSMCYGLNQTGGRIWNLFAQGRGIRSASDTIAREYRAPRRDVERDVLALAAQLAQRDLIKVVRPSSRVLRR